MSTFGELTSTYEAALTWYDAGCNVIPIRADGTKRPAVEWGALQKQRVSQDWVEAAFIQQPKAGIGVICGAVSNNLEMLELEGRACNSLAFDAIRFEAQARGIEALWDSLILDGYAEWTPSGGIHFLYRIADSHPVPGNTKIARRPATPEELLENPADKIKVLAETRGEGGYVIVAPTRGTVHPTGDSWSVAAGHIGDIRTITWQERQALTEAIHAALDEMPEPAPATPRPSLQSLAGGAGDRPGDDYNIRAEWADILQPHGWQQHSTVGKETFWTRPGKPKRDGHSATTGLMGTGATDRLYVFSSSTEFTPETPYNKFFAYALLNHGGDTVGAAKALRLQGYGRPLATGGYVSNTLTVHSIGEGEVLKPEDPSFCVPAVPTPTRDTLGLPVYDSHHSFDNIDIDGAGFAAVWRGIHNDTFRYVPSQKKWMMWQGDRWGWDDRLRHEYTAVTLTERFRNYAKASGDTVLFKEAKKHVNATAQASILRQARSHPDIAASMHDFDTDPNLVTVANGTLNLHTLKLQPHDPKLMLTRKVNAAYDPQASRGRWDKFMLEVLPDQDVRDYLQRACGYMLLGQMTERVMFLLQGETGSGKSQFLEALCGVLGDFAGVAPASAFQPRQQGYKGPSEDLHKLMGKRLVIQSELDAESKLNESLVKSITGADTQTTRTLYGEPVDWRPEYTMFFATNYLPRISSSDNAIWTRVKTVRFTEKFVDDNGAALNPWDRGLGRRMAAEEPEVILNWLIEGVAMYREHGLDEPPQIAEWLQEYRDDVDTTRQYLLEAPQEGRIVVEPGLEVSVRDNYRVYVAWCQDNTVKPVGMKTFNERLQSSGWKKEKRPKGIFWQGIGITGFLGAAQTPVITTSYRYEKRE